MRLYLVMDSSLKVTPLLPLCMYLVGSALTMCGSEEAVSVDRDCFIQHRAIEATGVSRCIAGHRVISGKGNLEQHDRDCDF